MPAAAVIPAPIAYIKVVAVKKLVVEFWACVAGPPNGEYWRGRPSFWQSSLLFTGWAREPGLLL